MKFYLVYYIYTLLEIFSTVSGYSHKKLKYFEVIDSSSIRHEIQKRSLKEGRRREMTLSFLGRTFQLSLVPKPELFSENFQAVTVDENGVETEFAVNKNDFYRGFVKGEEEHSSVTIQVDAGIVTAAIETREDTYHLEPAAGHIDGHSEDKMIAYKDSDVIWNVTFAGNHTQQQRYCDVARVDESRTERKSHDVPNKERDRRSTRERRALKTRRECGLALVADSLYFKHMGQGSRRKTLYSMVGVINRVDGIFKKTDWSDDPNDSYRNFGFVIKKIIIHEKATSSGYAKALSRPWVINELLQEFSRNDWSKFCLAHLFTYQDFDKGVIGLAYVANPDENIKGGICSEVDRGTTWHNTGLSSSINWGNQLLTTEADIVTAHELGHNFGSEHDIQDDPNCSPDSGGKYIMYPASVSGQEDNNNRFSDCSRKSIKAVLAAKANNCFSEPSQGTFCGNYRVEEGEMCDPGDNKNDLCCSQDCKLIGNATCSDSNFDTQCCFRCQYANNTTPCSQASPLQCKKAAYCTGTSAICPEQDPADEGTDCIERGKCNKKGECEPFCKSLGTDYEPCLCTSDVNACYVCCKKNGTCAVYEGNGTSGRIRMSNGRLCYSGVCREGNCEKEAQDIVTRLQDFFDTLGDPSKFGEFLKDNIVGTVIVFSLIAWIPLSILVYRIDKRRDKQAQELARWQDLANQELIRQPNKRRDNFDVVFKKDAVFLRDTRKAGKRVGPGGRRGPTVE